MRFKQYLFSRIALDTYLTTGSNGIYGLLTIWFFILASRALGPEKFGLLSIILAIYTIGFDTFNLGLSQALTRFVSAYLGRSQLAQANLYSSLILRFRLIQALFLFAVALFAGQLLGRFYNQPLLIIPISFSIAANGFGLIADYFVSLLRAYNQFAKSALLIIVNAVFKLVILFPVLSLGTPTLTLVTLAFVTSPIVVSLLGFFLAPKSKLIFSSSSQIQADIFHFSKWMALWGFTASLASRIDVIFLGKLASAYEAGIYSAAIKIASGYTLIGGSLSSVLTPKISRLIHQPDILKQKFRDMVKLALFLIAGMLLIMLLSPWFIPLVFGSQYLPSVPIFRILTLAAILFIAALPASVSLMALGFSKLIGLSSLIQLIVVSTLSVLFIPALGAQGAAWALCISFAVTLGITTIYASKKIFT